MYYNRNKKFKIIKKTKNYFKKNTQSISKLWAINTITNNIGKIVETKDKIYCIVNKNKIKYMLIQ